jgi:hypothetical protein
MPWWAWLIIGLVAGGFLALAVVVLWALAGWGK